MDLTLISSLLKPYVELSAFQLEQTARYLELLLKWNAKVNLTAVRDPEQMVTRHFGESFFAARQLLLPERECSVIDLGSGAGFPGLPFAVVAPKAPVVLIEANAKKTAFLNEVISALGLTNAKAVRQRGEEFRGTAEVVTMRAVERFELAAQIAARLVQRGGQLALMIGVSQINEAQTLEGSWKWEKAVSVPGSESRVVLVGTSLAKSSES